MNLNKNKQKGLKRLVFINVAFFLIANVIMSASGSYDLMSDFALSSSFMNVVLKPWTLLTSMFLHIDFFHLLFNMLYLFMFGQILSERLGSQSVVTVYLLGGIVGAIFYLLFYNLISIDPRYIAMGASGGVMAVMSAATTINPDRRVSIIFLGKIKIKWIFMFLFIMTSVYNINVNTGGKIDHMGGAMFGFTYITLIKNRNLYLGKWLDNICLYFSGKFSINKITFKTKKDKSNIKTGFRGAQDRRDKRTREVAVDNFLEKTELNEEIDKLLARVKKVGFDNLSESDKQRLIYLSKKM